MRIFQEQGRKADKNNRLEAKRLKDGWRWVEDR